MTVTLYDPVPELVYIGLGGLVLLLIGLILILVARMM